MSMTPAQRNAVHQIMQSLHDDNFLGIHEFSLRFDADTQQLEITRRTPGWPTITNTQNVYIESQVFWWCPKAKEFLFMTNSTHVEQVQKGATP